MNLRTRHLIIPTALTALSAVLASSANATIVGSTYEFSASSTGTTQIAATNGTYTDPSNPGFCLGPPVDCSSGTGISGSFAFAQVTPTLGTITFSFFGSTYTDLSGSFSIALGNFVTTDGETVTGVSYASGNLTSGSFSSVSFNSGTATFTGTPDTGGYGATGGRNVTFDVATTTTKVPEPSSLALFGTALLGFASIGSIGAIRRRRKQT